MMRRRTQVLALALLLPLPAGVRAQGTFEGVVTYRMEGGGAPGQMRYFQKGPRVRHEMVMGAQTTASIFNSATSESIMLIPGRKQYMVMNMKQMQGQVPPGAPGAAEKADIARMKVRATGQRETIAGIPCEHYLFGEATTGAVDICGAAGMGFMGGGAQGTGIPATAALAGSSNPQLSALVRRGFFPLKMSMSGHGNTMTWVATQVERKRLGEALFGPPAGYTRMSMPAMPDMGNMPGMPKMPKR